MARSPVTSADLLAMEWQVITSITGHHNIDQQQGIKVHTAHIWEHMVRNWHPCTL